MAKLFGVSVGTGDENLITVKGLNIIKSAPVIAYIHLPNKDSLALSIIKNHISDDKVHIPIAMPMNLETETASNAYDNGAVEIKKYLDAGKDVAFLCEGDSLFYGSFMYINDRIKSDYNVEIIPGVNSVSASSSALGMGLVSRNEILSVIPATNDEEKIISAIESADTIVIMKIGKHLNKIKDILTKLNLTDNAYCVINASHDNEQVSPLNQVETSPYFATIIIKKNTGLY
ncbi:MAG: precorrin-2 C(20)-methyltransferase [Alphaproteobacteria bacterium]